MTSLQLINGMVKLAKGTTVAQPTEEQIEKGFARMCETIKANQAKHNRIMCEGSSLRKWVYRTFKV